MTSSGRSSASFSLEHVAHLPLCMSFVHARPPHHSHRTVCVPQEGFAQTTHGVVPVSEKASPSM